MYSCIRQSAREGTSGESAVERTRARTAARDRVRERAPAQAGRRGELETQLCAVSGAQWFRSRAQTVVHSGSAVVHSQSCTVCTVVHAQSFCTVVPGLHSPSSDSNTILQHNTNGTAQSNKHMKGAGGERDCMSHSDARACTGRELEVSKTACHTLTREHAQGGRWR